MAVVIKIEPIDDWISVAIDKTLSPEAQAKAVADFARKELVEAQDTNRRVLGRVPPHDTYVDGRKGAAVDSVRPDGGTIIFEFELVTDVMIWIGNALRARSPVQSGAYRDAHTLFADGQEVPVGSAVPSAAEYVFLNPLPYARRIEVGKTKDGRAFVLQVPNRIYERTAADARQRFGNIAKITFSFTAVIGGRAVSQLAAASSGQSWWLGGAAARSATGAFEKTLGSTAHNKSNVRFPSITVRPN